MRNPVFVKFQKCPCAFDHLVDIKLRKTKLFVARVHPLEILVNAEHLNTLWIGMISISLGSFKALNGIVQGSICWIKLERLNWSDPRVLPSSIILVVITMQHMICKNTSKSVLMIVSWLFLKLFSLLDGKVLRVECLIARSNIAEIPSEGAKW